MSRIKVFFAGGYWYRNRDSLTFYERLAKKSKGISPYQKVRTLITYADDAGIRSLESVINSPVVAEVFLDSGAFSAFTQGVVISPKEFARFAIERKAVWGDRLLVAYLDVIGDWRASWENYRLQRSMGLDGIPTFHYGDDFALLHRVLAEGFGYIAIGGMVPYAARWRKALVPWLDKTFGIINAWERRLGYSVKVHCFGLAIPGLLVRYPWFSVDSASFLRKAAVRGEMLYLTRDGNLKSFPMRGAQRVPRQIVVGLRRGKRLIDHRFDINFPLDDLLFPWRQQHSDIAPYYKAAVWNSLLSVAYLDLMMGSGGSKTKQEGG